MAMNFLACDREQSFLMLPDPRDWLPEDHLAWFVLASVEEMDLAAFFAVYRRDGWGRAAFEPSMMVSLLLYAYARGERSSRGIERKCVEDVAYRVIAAQQKPDHATIARFRARHEDALAELFSSVLSLCKQAGLVKVGVIAIDGTKVHANASHHCNLDYEQLAKEILKEASEIDAAEDELYGEACGDELPEHLRTREGRQAALKEAKQKLEAERTESESAKSEAADEPVAPAVRIELDSEVIVARIQGRDGWLREARHQLDEHRRREAKPIPRSRAERLLEAERRLQQDLEVERTANEAYEHYRAHGRDTQGRRLGCSPKPYEPYEPPEIPAGKINTTDLDSRNVKTPRSYTQGYNAQAVVNEEQIVLAAEVTASSPDFGHLQPMVTATKRELHAIGVTETPGVAVADSGYWNEEQMDNVIANEHVQVLIPPDAGKRDTPRPGWDGGRYTSMREALATDYGGGLYRRRKAMVEPVFAQTKHNRRINQFQRRDRSAARSEWRLITATHNLLKLHKHQIALAAT
jgi:transposase